MKQILILLSAVVLIQACHFKQPETTISENNKADTGKKNYLPVSDYLKAEIAAVDSFPLRIMKYRVINGKTDSGIITTAAFDQIAKEFLMPDLDSSRFENKFEENSFVDRSTNLVSFTYSTKDPGNGLKRVDVLLTPGTGIEKLHSIYMEAYSVNKDTAVISKLSWRAGKNFNIVRIRNPKNSHETTDQTMVVWDSRE